MDLKFMTPTEVWDGYNPVKEPLETSIISSEENGNLAVNKVFFTSEKTASGRVRAFAEIYYDKSWSDARAALLVAPPIDALSDVSVLVEALVNEGYVVCLLDYSGSFKDNVNHTSFPNEYAYAAYPECNKHMLSIESDARGTPWFQWSKIVRRAVSMLAEHRLVADSRIGLIGLGAGAQIAWQTAGIDGRIRALIAVNGGGYLWAGDSSSIPIPETDHERAFSSGAGAETYARFVTCPTCFAVSSNSEYFNVDRAGDIINSVPAEFKRLIISAGTDIQITESTFEGILVWLNRYFAHDGETSVFPSLSFETIEEKLYLRLRTGAEAEKIQLYVCHGEAYSPVRYWQELYDPQKTATQEYTYSVPVIFKDAVLCAFANVNYAGGILASTPVACVIPEKLGVGVYDTAAVSCNKLVYNGSMRTGSFRAATNSVLLEENVLSVKEGPFGIKGVTVSEGNLILYRRTYAKNLLSLAELLQFDAYSADAKTFTLNILAQDLNYYSVLAELTGGEFWQKIALHYADFKNAAGKPLQRFDESKLFVFADAENVIFNNILWI